MAGEFEDTKRNGRGYPCTDPDCAEVLSTVKDWGQHMKEQHDGVSDEDVERLVDGARRGPRETLGDMLAVRLRAHDRVYLSQLADKRNVREGECLRQLLADQQDREKPDTPARLTADANALAERLREFAKTAKNREVIEDAARQIAETVLFIKGEKKPGFWG